MEPKFFNLCQFTKRNLTEQYVKQRSVATWVALAVGQIYFIAASVLILRYADGILETLLGAAVAAGSVAYLITVIFRPHLSAAAKASRDTKKYGSTMKTVYSFFDDTLRVECLTNGKSRDVKYEDIVAVTQTKHLILLRTATTVYPLTKTGFRNGTKGDFLALIRDRAPSAKCDLEPNRT